MPEAVASGQHVEELGQRANERKADADQVERAQPGRVAGQHEHEAGERHAERGPPQAVEAIAEPDDRYHGHQRGIEVEDEQRQRDADAR